MQIAENSSAVAGTNGQQSQKRVCQKCGTSCNVMGSKTQTAGESLYFVDPEQVKKDLETFTGVLALIL